ncbi:MAG: hypothetical protein LBG65_07015 [Puniceicoccales bacterium]|jgi:hypothetical protein|nr:hypothetical protein [Puniceicoccales bacterium]
MKPPKMFSITLLALAVQISAHVMALAETRVEKGAAGIQVEIGKLPASVVAQPFVFVTRNQYAKGHHNTETFFPSAKNEFNNGRYNPGGALKVVDFKKGTVVTLLEVKDGVVRDPEVSWDGGRILFSMRRARDDSYHVYEINADGTGLRQLTSLKDVDDLDPFYLADGHIGFSSTREPKYCGCNRHIMANLYRMEPDGANIHQISKNPLFDGHGTLLPDGRVLYDRWEYVDRNYGDAQGLWTCNPDGTNHAIYWGNNTPAPGGVIDGRPVPGTERVAAIFTSTHDRPWGALAILDRRLGIDGPAPVVRIWPEAARDRVWESDRRAPARAYGTDNMRGLSLKYEDPQPLDSRHLLCSRQLSPGSDRTGIFLLDMETGSETLLYAEERLGAYDATPLAARARPPVLPARRSHEPSVNTGTFYVLDVYNGTHMQGVSRGSVKYLRIVETPEKRFWTLPAWNAQGSVSPAMTWDEFMAKRIIGTVPVNPDGSAYFEVPAEKFLYFQLLDKDGLMVQTMRSGAIVQPGEQNGCVGCHDDRLASAPVSAKQTAMALLRRQPDKPVAWPGLPGKTVGGTAVSRATPSSPGVPETAAGAGDDLPPEFSYLRDVQPVFDRHCVSCHNPGKPAGRRLNLSGAPGQIFNPSYGELWAKRYIRPIGAGPARILQPRAWGSSVSALTAFLRKRHGGVMLEKDDPEAFHRVVSWIDLNAPYYPSYATSYPRNDYGRSPLTREETSRLEKLLGKKISAWHSGRNGDFFVDDPMWKEAPGKPSNRDAVNLRAVLALNFSEPEKSPALAELKSSAPDKYALALAIVQKGAARVRENGDNGLAQFQMCPLDAWRQGRYDDARARELASRRAIAAGKKFYDTDNP